LKDVSTGAQNDLERATSNVREMITRYGMSEELGAITFGKRQDTIFLGRDISQERNYSEAIAYAIDKEARAMIDAAYQRADNILAKNLPSLNAVAEALMQYETLEAEDFYQIMRKYCPDSNEEEKAPHAQTTEIDSAPLISPAEGDAGAAPGTQEPAEGLAYRPPGSGDDTRFHMNYGDKDKE